MSQAGTIRRVVVTTEYSVFGETRRNFVYLATWNWETDLSLSLDHYEAMGLRVRVVDIAVADLAA